MSQWVGIIKAYVVQKFRQEAVSQEEKPTLNASILAVPAERRLAVRKTVF